jgi:hypothetical protein
MKSKPMSLEEKAAYVQRVEPVVDSLRHNILFVKRIVSKIEDEGKVDPTLLGHAIMHYYSDLFQLAEVGLDFIQARKD